MDEMDRMDLMDLQKTSELDGYCKLSTTQVHLLCLNQLPGP